MGEFGAGGVLPKRLGYLEGRRNGRGGGLGQEGDGDEEQKSPGHGAILMMPGQRMLSKGE